MELHGRSCLGCVHSECLRLQFHWRRCFDATIRDRETHRFEAGLVLLMMITSRRSSLTTKKWDYYQRGRQEAALLDRCCRSWNEEMQTSHRKILAATMKLELQRRSPAGVSAVLFGAFWRVGVCFLGEVVGVSAAVSRRRRVVWFAIVAIVAAFVNKSTNYLSMSLRAGIATPAKSDIER